MAPIFYTKAIELGLLNENEKERCLQVFLAMIDEAKVSLDPMFLLA